MPEILDPTTNTTPKGKPFPWHCPRCRAKDVWPAEVAYEAELLHDGFLHKVQVARLTVPRCGRCGELVFGDDAGQQISNALRDHLHLLRPEQIRQNREKIGLDRKELAERLRVAEELIEQWEEGMVVQTGLADRALRGCFAVSAYREALAEMSQNPNLG